VEHDLLKPLERALANRRQGSLEDLLLTDSRHEFPIPGAGSLAEAAGLSLYRLGTQDNSNLDRENLARQWLAHFAGWDSAPRGRWQALQLRPAQGGKGYEVDWQVRFAGHHQTGVLQSLALEMRWNVVKVPLVGFRIQGLTVQRGLRGLATKARYAEVGAWVGLNQPLTAASREGLRERDAQGTLPAAGLTCLDWNADGFPDYLVTRHGSDTQLFLNDGRSGFSPGLLPLRIPEESPGFLLAADLDNDGLDELVGTRFLRYAGELGYLGLYTRTRSGFWSLEDNALPVPIGTSNRAAVVHGITPLDVDRDGLLDFVLALGSDGPKWNSTNHRPDPEPESLGQRNVFFRNLGDLKFEEIGSTLGLDSASVTRQLTTLDWNGDGLQDLFECNAAGFVDHLWLATPQGGFREPPGWAPNQAFLGEGHPGAVALLDQDPRRQALFVLGPLTRLQPLGLGSGTQILTAFGNQWLQPTISGPTLDLSEERNLRHTGNVRTAVSLDIGNRGSRDWAIGANAEDGSGLGIFVALDGDPLAYEDVAPLLGLANLPSIQALLPSDFDGDGDQDLVIVGADGSLRLLADQGSHGAFVEVLLNAQSGSAFGSTVEVHCQNRVQRAIFQPLVAATTQPDRALRFGLGSATEIASIVVHWASGKTSTYAHLPVSERLILDEEHGTWLSTPVPSWSEPPPQNRALPEIGGFARLLSGKNHPLGRLGCTNVVHWVKTLDHNQPFPFERVAAMAGLDLELSLVMLDADGWTPTEGLPYSTYVGDKSLRTEFLGDGDLATLPATFVFDSSGAMIRAFQGAIPEEDLLGVLERISGAKAYPELLVGQGFRALDARDYAAAQAAFGQAIEHDATRADAYIGLAHALRYQGNTGDALVAATQATRVDPDFALAFGFLGALQLSQGQGDKARFSFQKVLKLDGSNPRNWYSLCEAAMQAEAWPEGLNAINQALRLLPESARALRADSYCLRGKLLEHLDRDPEARKAYESALQLDPAHPEALDCHNRMLGRVPE
jgi:Flp pilus assembly protein TadD